MADRGAAANAAQQSRSGGCGASRGARRLRRLRAGGTVAPGVAGHRPDAAPAARRRDAARSVRQAGRGVPDTRGRATRLDRELAPRAQVGDVGRVPPTRGRGADDVRADDGGVVDLHRHPGHFAGHLPDVLRGRRGALRLGRPCRADGPDRWPRWHGRGSAARRDDGRGSDSLRRGRSALDRPAPRDAVRRRAGFLSGRRGGARAGGRGGASAAVGGAARECGRRVPGARRARGALRPRHGSDRGARSADRIRPGRGAVRGGGGRCGHAIRSGISRSPPSRS